MIKITLDDKTIEVNPNLTIRQYMDMQKNPHKYKTPKQILSFYLGISEDELDGLPVEKVQFIESILSTHIENPKLDIVYTFNFNGITYGLENNWGELKWSQWTDMEVFGHRDKITENIHILMALLYREIKVESNNKYTLNGFSSSSVMERANLFLDLPISYWFGASNFFFRISTEYIKLIEVSLKQKMLYEKWTKPLRKILPKKIQAWLLPDITFNLPTSLLTETSLKSNE
jgi:hypothetical protein